MKLLFAAICIVTSMALLFCISACDEEEGTPVKLSGPDFEDVSLMQALQERKSSRLFSSKRIPDKILSNLLWAANGINRPTSGNRTAPSAFGAHEIDIYVATAHGLYLYDAEAFALKRILKKDIRSLTGKQGFVKTVPINLVYVADFSKLEKAGEAEKIIYSSAGAGFISQNVYLYCAAEGLATVVRGWIDKSALARAMKLAENQKIILAQSVGYSGK